MHFARDEALGHVRDCDVYVMTAFWDLGFRGADFRRLNRVCKYHCVIHKSDLTACDGRTVLDLVFRRVDGQSTRHRFPLEQPEGGNLCLWKRAVELLCVQRRLRQEVGRYLQHTYMDWM